MTLPHEYDQINIICPVYSAAVLEQVIPMTLPHEYDQINIICPVYDAAVLEQVTRGHCHVNMIRST
jgi:hypothetical protein